jgi:hypothetical protein
LFTSTRVLAVLITAIAGLTACSAKTPSASTDAQTSLPFSNFGNVSAMLFGMATFAGFGQTLTKPVEFAIPPVSISWMGTIFSGSLEGAGAGEDVTYQVHGSVSSDGARVESMLFSQEVIQQSAGQGNFFRITLRNVPLIRNRDAQGNAEAVTDETGADVQRYLVQIEYATGPLGGTQTPPIISNFTYVCCDWSNATCVAELRVTLATGPGTPAGGGTTVPMPAMDMDDD